MTTYTCKNCSLEFGYTPSPELASFKFTPSVCDPCALVMHDKEASERHARKAKASKDKWEALCPIEFRTIEEGGNTDMVRVATEQAKGFDALSWKFGARGMLLVGASGKCKTRIAWRVLRREFDAGRKIASIKAHRFGLEAVQKQMSSGFKDWFDELVEIPLLFIDDLGKGKLTEAVESHLFGLLDERSEHGRPCIITTNSCGKELIDKMSQDRGEPIVRRLRDYCDVVTFE